MGISAGIFAVTSTVTRAMSQRSAGRINARIAGLNADISEFNADVADWQAEDALKRGRYQETQLRKDVKRLMGSQRANLAAQGVDVSDLDSSATEIQEDTAAMGELDALMVRNNAFREAMGYRVQAANASLQGQVYRARGALVESAGNQAATSTLLTGASQAYGIYRQFGE